MRLWRVTLTGAAGEREHRELPAPDAQVAASRALAAYQGALTGYWRVANVIALSKLKA